MVGLWLRLGLVRQLYLTYPLVSQSTLGCLISTRLPLVFLLGRSQAKKSSFQVVCIPGAAYQNSKPRFCASITSLTNQFVNPWPVAFLSLARAGAPDEVSDTKRSGQE
jgi:hypothetical protein